MKDLGEANHILGIQIIRDCKNRLLALSQASYINKVLIKFSMQNSKKGNLPSRHGVHLSKKQCPKTPQEEEDMRQIPYASAVSSLMYAMLCTRPDICFTVRMVSRYQSNLGLDHWVSVKHILKYLRKARNYMLVYCGGDLIPIGYTDSNFQTYRDSRKSTSKANSLWEVESLYGEVSSNLVEAEYVVTCEATKEVVWLHQFLKELQVVPNMHEPITLYCETVGQWPMPRSPETTVKEST